MPWAKVSDQLWGSPKWMQAPNGARSLWVTALSWSMDQLTDGHVPDFMLRTFGATRKDANALVKVGLWEPEDDGWRFHDWLEYQPSRQKIEAERKAAADRMAERRRNNTGKFAGSSPEQEAKSQRSSAGVTSTPTRPDPTRPELPNGSSGTRKRATSLPTDWRPTAEHVDRANADGLDLDRELVKFRAYADEKGRTAKSWNAAFTRWLMNAAEYAKDRRPANPEAGTGFWGRSAS